MTQFNICDIRVNPFVAFMLKQKKTLKKNSTSFYFSLKFTSKLKHFKIIHFLFCKDSPVSSFDVFLR